MALQEIQYHIPGDHVLVADLGQLEGTQSAEEVTSPSGKDDSLPDSLLHTPSCWLQMPLACQESKALCHVEVKLVQCTQEANIVI